jgi:hypothetical protein
MSPDIVPHAAASTKRAGMKVPTTTKLQGYSWFLPFFI